MVQSIIENYFSVPANRTEPLSFAFFKGDTLLGMQTLNISTLKEPLLRLILFYFCFCSRIFLPDFLPCFFAHSWSIYFCHFNSSSWSSAIISEFYGSLHRYSGGVLLILLWPHGNFTKTLGWYLAVPVELPPGIQTEGVKGGQRIGKHKSGLCKQAWWMLVPKVLCLLSNLYIGRKAVQREWWIIKLLPGERASIETTAVTR